MPDGMLEPGNINLYARPQIANPDGSWSSLNSMSFGDDRGVETLVPGVNQVRRLEPAEAIKQFLATGQHLGKFSSPAAADSYAQALHEKAAIGAYKPPMASSHKSIDAEKLRSMLIYMLQHGPNAL